MSYIHKTLNGKYEVGIAYQDGIERSECDTEAEAIESYIQGERLSRGFRDTGPVRAPVIVDKSRWPVVAVAAAGMVTVAGIEDAIRLALSRRPLDPGSNYELRVEFVKVAGGEPYEGAGI